MARKGRRGKRKRSKMLAAHAAAKMEPIVGKPYDWAPRPSSSRKWANHS